ncbi:MAG: hypothetical protein R3F20_02770 [Planctomycetota bacterium]
MRRALVIVLVLVALGAAHRLHRERDDLARGLELAERGDLAAAHEALARAEADRGESAPAALVFDRAVVALAANDPAAAEIAAERLAARAGGDAPVLATRDFLLGGAAFARGLASEALSARPEAGVPELDAAIAQFEIAARHWRGAALAASDPAPAIRNVERTLIRLEALRKSREERAKKKEGERPRDGDREESAPEDPPEGRPEETLADLAPRLDELAPDELRSLRERLAEKEREKRRLRREARERATAPGSRDW